MKTKVGFASSLLLLLAVLVWMSSDSAGNAAAPQARNAVIFAVSPGTPASSGQMLPILMIENGEYKNPIAGDSDEADIKRFADSRYRKGQAYRLIFGGSAVGSVGVTKFSGGECSRTSADVNIKTDQRLNKDVMALATDSKTLGIEGSRSRRAPTATERTQALDLARAAYREKGVPAALLTNLQTINLTASDLDHDGHAELIGSFVASKRTSRQARYPLFLLAEPNGANYRRALLVFDKMTGKDIMSGATLNAVNEGVHVETLIDHLNLDGQGWDELFTTSRGFEGDAYRIYKRQNGQWASVYEFNNYRCAF